MLQLSDLQPGDSARIVKLTKADPFYRQSLLAMGLTPGTIFRVVRIAPFGDPIELLIRGYALTLRKQEAAGLRVEKLSHNHAHGQTSQ